MPVPENPGQQLFDKSVQFNWNFGPDLIYLKNEFYLKAAYQ